MALLSVYLSLGLVLIIISISGQNTNREEYHMVCRGDWQKKMIDKQRRIISGSLHEGRYIINIPVKAGFADMIHGYVAGFIWSMFTDRAFIIHHIDDLEDCQQRSIEFAYEPHLINWSVKIPFNDSIYKCMMPPYGSTACPGAAITSGGTEGLLFQQINAGLRQMFYESNISTYPTASDADHIKLFFFASNRGITYHIFNNTYHGSELYSYGLTPETLFPCIFHLLFKAKPEICDIACQKTENKLRLLGNNSNNVLIGIHVRDEQNSEAVEHFFCAERLIQHYKSMKKDPYILLVTASEGLQRNMKNKFGEKLLLPEGEPQKPQVVHSRDDGKTNDEKCEFSKNKDRIAMLESARDMHLLSLAEIQIVSRDSGFGIVGAMMRPRKTPIVYRMAITSPPTLRMCDTFLGGDKIDVFADSWSGL